MASSHGLSSDDHDDAGAAPILLLAGRGCNAAHAGARRLVLAFGAKYRTVAVTDRAIVMCRSSMWRPYKAKEFGARLPRSIQLGPAKGFLVPFVRILWDFGDGTATVWYTMTIGPDKVHIHRRFQDDLRQADAAIGVIW